jgi:excisionase family DNA binding protein
MATNEAKTKASSGKEEGYGPGSDLMTVNEVADYLRCHTASIYRLLKRRKIPAFKVGFDWRFSRRAIDAWTNGPFETQRRRTKEPSQGRGDSTIPL